MNDELNILAEQFRTYFGLAPEKTELITGSGSQRQYYRLKAGSQSAIGTIGTDTKENKAFIEFAKHFKQKGLNVPEVFLHSEDLKYYIQEDFGDADLLGILLNSRTEGEIPQHIMKLYEKAITELVRLQINGDEGLDYSLCFPRKEFDRTSIMWDLNYFKYYFLKMVLPEIDENGLEEEFSVLCDFLLSVEKKYFMYRDFQARNIIIKDSEAYFIDFQGGRKGPLQYDIASLLFQAKANISDDQKSQLLDFYISELNKKINYPKSEFMQYFDGFVIIRILQTLGAYGFRGIIQQKKHFIQSIPNALANFQKISDNWTLPFDLKMIRGYIEKITYQKFNFSKSVGTGRDLSTYAANIPKPVGTGRDLSAKFPLRKRNRLESNDYSKQGFYFITICCQNNNYYFGEIQNGKMNLNQLGKIAKDQIIWLESQYSYIKIHNSVVMPNHVHFIIEIADNAGTDRNQAEKLNNNPKTKSISELVGAYKTTSSKKIHLYGNNEFLWERSFYDHVIRNEKSYLEIYEYISENPQRWELDKFH